MRIFAGANMLRIKSSSLYLYLQTRSFGREFHRSCSTPWAKAFVCAHAAQSSFAHLLVFVLYIEGFDKFNILMLFCKVV